MKIALALYLFIGMFITFIGEREVVNNEGPQHQLNIIQRLTLFCTWPIFFGIAIYRKWKRGDL